LPAPTQTPGVRGRGEPVGLKLSGVMLPELDVGVRPACVLRQIAERGAVGEHRKYGARREIRTDADDVLRGNVGLRQCRRNGLVHGIEIVAGNLQRPIRR
jgi:hypothetical protein